MSTDSLLTSAEAFKPSPHGDGKLSREELPGAPSGPLEATRDGLVTEEEASALWKHQ